MIRLETEEIIRRCDKILELQLNMVKTLDGILDKINERIDNLENKVGMMEG